MNNVPKPAKVMLFDNIINAGGIYVRTVDP